MDRFGRRFFNNCKNLICRNKGYTLAHQYDNKVMSDSVALDLNDQANWVDQGKPLMTNNGEVGSLANHRSPSSSNNVTPKNGILQAPISQQISKNKYSELPRFILSYVYMSIFGLANAFVVIIAHDWTPDRSKYLPLPDLILKNIPYFPWAFHASEGIAMGFLVIFAILMSVHKHRTVIARRLFIIYGTVLLMRCPCLLFTSLTIPTEHLQCDPVMNDTMWSKFQRAGSLYMKLGMSSQGVKTCGDYMFSGHTVFLSLLNYVITEYTPFVLLHVFTWLIALVAMSFIVMGKAHYSIDVIVAFFISSLYFNYYHTLANHRNPQDDLEAAASPTTWFRRLCFVTRRQRVWIPFFGFLEKGTGGTPIPNEYESPLAPIARLVRHVRHRVVAGKSRHI